MAEQTEIAKPRSDAARRKTTAKSRLARQSHTARNRFLILLFLFVAVLAASGYLLMELALMRGEVASLASENAALAEREAAQTATIESMQEQLAAPPEPAPLDLTALEALEQRLRQENDSLSTQIGEISTAQRSLQAAPEFGWKVQEAAYLLSLANRRLQLEADITGAITLLESADQALLEAQQNGVLHIRQSIAEEAAALRALEAVDREGIYFRLQGLQTGISQLDLLGSLRESAGSGGNEGTATTAESGWMAAGIEFLGNVFIWRRWEERPEVERAMGRQEVIEELIRLRIAQAQFALLRRDGAIYRASLQAALDELQPWAGGESVAQLTSELNELLSIEIAPELPVPGESLNLVGEYLAGLPQ